MVGVAVDPSGNLWGTNNWKVVPPANNPGGDAIVIFVGIAAPLVDADHRPTGSRRVATFRGRYRR